VKRLLAAVCVLAAAPPAAAHPDAQLRLRHCAHRVVLGSLRVSYAGIVRHRATAYRRPGARPFAHFGRRNVNGVLTVFAVRAAVRNHACRPTWYRVQLPLRPNGTTGWVRARALALARVRTRILVDLSERRLTFYRRGRVRLRLPVAIGSRATPTPRGFYYVNQRLVPLDTSGPYGPAALGISAFSPVLLHWAQGGPIAVHGTDEPDSIGHARSSGCIRVRNAMMKRLFAATPAGTPVLIRA
jgi:lipoprotein-anchoring transpeptidase ErfK/SrfK